MIGLGHNGGPRIDEDDGQPFDRDGWIAVARTVRDHWLVGFGQPVTPADPSYGAHSRTEAWLDLIMECRYAEGTVNNNGRKMKLQAGQLLGATSWLAARWNWTPKTVRGFLDKLDEEGMISRFPSETMTGPDNSLNGSQKGKNKGRFANVLTICKYALYQLGDRTQGQVAGPVEGRLRAGSGPVEGNIYKEETKEQGNKGTKEETSPAGEGAPPEPVIADAIEAVIQADAIQALDAFRAYNELAQKIGLPIARTLTPQRRKNLCARLREHGGMDAWQTALSNIERSAFLRGNNARGWRADFDFLLSASKFAKVVDGVYGNGAHAEQPKESQAERYSRMLDEMEQEKRS